MASFRRRVGAVADVKELEYVAALHQSCMPSLRENGTVSSVDICRFLKSRAGLNVPHAQGIRVVRGLGGGLVSDDVIQMILEEMKDTNHQEELEKKHLKKKINSARSLGCLAKRGSRVNDANANVETMIHGQDFLTMEPYHSDVDTNEDKRSPQERNDNNEDDLEALAGDEFDGVENEEYLDLVQLLAILLMPTLARAGHEWHEASVPKAPKEQPSPPSTSGWLAELKYKRQLKIAERHRQLHESLRPMPHTILKDTYKTILQSIDYSYDGNSYPVLNAQLVQRLLVAFGEHERAADAVLVDKMVEAATMDSGKFDEEAFVAALTSDLKEWKVEAEDQQTTSCFDVWGYESYREKATIEEEQEKEEENDDGGEILKEGSSQHLSILESGTVDDDAVKAVLQINESNNGSSTPLDEAEKKASVVDTPKMKHEGKATSRSDSYELDRPRQVMDIDFSIDAHSSVTLVVSIFFFFICTSLIYASLILQIPDLKPDCGQDFGCTLGSKVITWMLYAIILSVSGYLVIIPLSIGNSPVEREPVNILFALGMSLLITWIPYIAVKAYEASLEPPYDTGPEQTINRGNYNAAQWVTRTLGSFTSLLILFQLCLSLIGNRQVRASHFLSNFFPTSNIRGTARSKKAATRKLNTVLENGYALNAKALSGRSGSALNEETMMNFFLRGERYEDAGGLSWTWKRLFSGALFDHEGVWICSRLIIIQVVQLFLIAFYIYTGLLLVDEIAQKADQAQAGLRPDYPQWVHDIVPTASQVRIALYPALGISVLVMILIFLAYVPSYVGKVLGYRCGELPSLKSSEFIKYRIAVDAVYTNIGNAMFALIGSALLFFALFGLVLFLFIWEFSKGFMTLLVAWVLGLVITVVLKMIIVKNCRKRQYAGLFRTKPVGANLAVLALECWFIGMGGGVLVGRLVQFILAACFFVGRTDIPFLSKDVALFGYAFDYVPTNFVKDILVHEAHRHPYMERLLAMYMMKLKCDTFGTEAGSCWRQLFVVALLPWFTKLRVFTDHRLATEDGSTLYNAKRLERSSLVPFRVLTPTTTKDINGDSTMRDGSEKRRQSSKKKALKTKKAKKRPRPTGVVGWQAAAGNTNPCE